MFNMLLLGIILYLFIGLIVAIIVFIDDRIHRNIQFLFFSLIFWWIIVIIYFWIDDDDVLTPPRD